MSIHFSVDWREVTSLGDRNLGLRLLTHHVPQGYFLKLLVCTSVK